MNISKTRIYEVVMLFIFKILLDVIYIFYVSQQYEYSGFTLDMDAIKMIESYVFLFLIYVLLNKNDRRFSGVVIKFLFLLMLVPILSLYGLKNESRLFLYSIVLSFIITILISKLRIMNMPRLNNSKKILFFIVPIMSLITYVTLIIYNGLPTLKAFNFSQIYEIRSETVWGPFFMSYLVVWQAKIINLFIIGIGIFNKNKKLIILGVSLQILLFLITGHKNYLFSPLLLLGFIFAIKKGKTLLILLTGLISVIIVSSISYYSGLSGSLASLFIRRVFFVPAQNNFLYYDFFSKESFVHLSHSILSPIFTYNYALPPQNLIGLYYFNSTEMWANGGFLGDAYMNFGFVGMFVFSMILGFVLLLLDSISNKIDITIVLATTIISLQSLINGALLTSLLTGGLLFGILLLILYANNIEKNSKPLH